MSTDPSSPSYGQPESWKWQPQPGQQMPPDPYAGFAPQLTSGQEATAEQRRHALAMAVGAEVARGARVESQTDTTAMLVFGTKPNHVLHLILTLVTCLMWSVVWIIVLVVQQEHRVSLTVDPYGQILRQQLS